MRRAIVGCAVLALLAAPAPAQAWGYEAHRFIMDRAIDLLPPELRPLFEAHRAMVVERAIDPDTWQSAGYNAVESPHHFLDLDWDGYGKYPFTGLPRDYSAAIAKFGKSRVDENGTLPWRTEEIYGSLRRAFEGYQRRGPFGRWDILFMSAWLAHYVSDAHVPFHAVVNYDGQLTGQHGIHARFEAYLFERYEKELKIAPKQPSPIHTPRDFIFDTAADGTQLVATLLRADADAIGTRNEYDDAYYDAFFRGSRGVLEQRLNESITAVVGMITGAWEAAGKPPVPVHSPEPPQRRRR